MTTSSAPKGPPGGRFTGNLGELRRDPLGFFTMCARQYGDFVPLHFGPVQAVFLNRPEYIEYVLTSGYENFTVGSGGASLKPWMGDGLVIASGETWRRHRPMDEQAFTLQHSTRYVEVLTRRTVHTLSRWSDGESRDMYAEMLRLNLETLVEAYFGLDPETDGKELAEAIWAVQQTFMIPMEELLLPIPQSLPTGKHRRTQSALAHLDDLLFPLIEQRRASGVDHEDVLSLLMRATDDAGQTMTNRELRDEIVTIYLGSEPTADSLAWACYALSEYPEAQENVAREVQTVLGGRTPHYVDRRHLTYTQTVITEVNRLYPAVWLIARHSLQECEIDGRHIPKGVDVFLCAWTMHRDPRYYQHPEAFFPTRWTSSFTAELPRFAYFPFGGGPHRCLGNAFAVNGSVLALAAIVQSFQLTLASGHPVTPHPGIGLRPRDDMPMIIRRR